MSDERAAPGEAGPAEPTPRSLRGSAGQWLAGSALLAGLVGAVHWTVGWPALLAPWRELPATHLAGLLALAALSYVLRAVRAHDALRAQTGSRFLPMLRVTVLHTTANNLLPMRLGEAAFPLLVRRYFGLRLTRGTLALAWIRLMDLHVLALVGIVAWLLSAADRLLPSIALAAAILALPAAVRLLPIVARRFTARGLAGRLLRAVRDTGPADAFELARLYLWTVLSWGAKLAAFAAIVAHFLDAPAGTLLAGIVGAELSSVLPFHGVAGAGSYEAAMVAALYPLGVAPAAALGAAVNLHLFLLGVTLLSSLAALLIPVPPARAAADPVAEDANRA
ncbi:MAG: flippase-like domain-containing protein [Gammaproteobacteria bacterium]|jgi:uncharacterized membrane protein YbhN (UPF0104 family)|nr:flippase-like domain-containing protein [Gammaproteobacteria bacterium]